MGNEAGKGDANRIKGKKARERYERNYIRIFSKQCTKCKRKLPATREYFPAHKQTSDGLCSQCKQCHNGACKQWRKQNREKHNEYKRQYYKTIKGYLGYIWRNINRRCYNPKHKLYHRYGERGIQNKFESLDEFRDYVINALGYDTYDKIAGLQIDRIDNNGHYKPDNIRFVSAKENCNNRG